MPNPDPELNQVIPDGVQCGVFHFKLLEDAGESRVMIGGEVDGVNVLLVTSKADLEELVWQGVGIIGR